MSEPTRKSRAEVAYDAWALEVASFLGAQPPFDRLEPALMDAWNASARAVERNHAEVLVEQLQEFGRAMTPLGRAMACSLAGLLKRWAGHQ